MLAAALLFAVLPGSSPLVADPSLPLVYVDRDDFVVDTSCRLELAPSLTEIIDTKQDGFIRVVGHNIEVDASALTLKGQGGIGVRVLADGVRWHGGNLAGFAVGLKASGIDFNLSQLALTSCDVGLQITGERFAGSSLLIEDGDVGLEALEANGGKLQTSLIDRMGKFGIHLDGSDEWQIHANAIASIYGTDQAAGVGLTGSGRNHSIRGNTIDRTEYGIWMDTGDVHLGLKMTQDAKERGLVWPPPDEEIALFKGQGFQNLMLTENLIRDHRQEAIWLRGVADVDMFGNQCVGPGPGMSLQFAEGIQSSQNYFLNNRPQSMMLQDCGVSRIDASTFEGDRSGVVVQNSTDVDELPPWAWAHLRPSNCSVTDCSFNSFELALDFGTGPGEVRLGGNQFEMCDRSLRTTGATSISVASGDTELSPPKELVLSAPNLENDDGSKRIVQNKRPWNGVDPILIRGTEAPGFLQFQPSGQWESALDFTFEGEAEVVQNPDQDRITIRAVEKDRFERWQLETKDQSFSGVLSRGWWKGFMWKYSADPVTETEAWRDEAELGWTYQCREPNLDFGRMAPGELHGIFPVIRNAGLPSDGFGLICEAERWLPAGTWTLTVEANDGVRVRIDDTLVIDAWEGPTQKVFTHQIKVKQETVHRFAVEWYERTGIAYLRVMLKPQSE